MPTRHLPLRKPPSLLVTANSLPPILKVTLKFLAERSSFGTIKPCLSADSRKRSGMTPKEPELRITVTRSQGTSPPSSSHAVRKTRKGSERSSPQSGSHSNGNRGAVISIRVGNSNTTRPFSGVAESQPSYSLYEK